MGNSDSKQQSASDAPAMRASMPPATHVSSAPALRSTSHTGEDSAAIKTTKTTTNSSTTTKNRPRHRNGETDRIEAGGIARGQQATEDATNQLSYWYLLKHGYNELVNLIIRPPRAQYTLADLGPSHFSFGGLHYIRNDFTVVNDRQQTLQCSHWRPDADVVNGVDTFPTVVYLHGNSSCRVEALSVLRTCLASGLTVVAFDCAGCGLSDGAYISLGYFERDDVAAVIAYLRAHANVSTIGLWGRSMGAATALLHADRDPTIAGIVVDSAFTTLETLVAEIVARGRQEGYTIPGWAVKLVMKCIRASVQKRAGFDLRHLAPIDHVTQSYVPALFVAAIGDEFIGPHHSDALCDAYAGDKNVVKVKGDHNTVRPQYLLDSAGIFLHTALHVDARLCPDAPPPPARGRNRLPWASSASSNADAWGLRMADLNAAFGTGKATTAAALRDGPTHDWACLQCTFVNSAMRAACEMCRALYVASEQAQVADVLQQHVDNDDDDDVAEEAAARELDADTIAIAMLSLDAERDVPTSTRTI